MGTSLLTRKRDLAYFVYFAIHIPVMFLVDLQALYPPSLVPAPLTSLKAFYMQTYKDLFFVAPPPFFKLFMGLELVYHVPVSLWALKGLWSSA
ncbi:hypothetical protein B7494_g8629 [Chlorociboria aeruginascens]|nr:hypothetical protein B7494_g8629 [Chlorociboria aeruginascens]